MANYNEQSRGLISSDKRGYFFNGVSRTMIYVSLLSYLKCVDYCFNLTKFNCYNYKRIFKMASDVILIHLLCKVLC